MNRSTHAPAIPMSTRAMPNERVLSPALQAATGILDVMDVGRTHYYADAWGEWPAVVLIHSVNAAASAFEMRPIFDALKGRRRVFALDLPGFGRSERADREYTPELYAKAIERFVVDVVSPQGAPVDAVALSLSSEFLARAAHRSPGLFRSLTLLSPTGFSAKQDRGALAQSVLSRVLHLPLLSGGLFKLVTTERSIRYFLKKSFVGPVDEGLVRYAAETAAMPGAKHAPLTFLSGKLFTPHADKALYEPLTVPTTVVYDQDAYSDFDRLDAIARANPRIVGERVAPTKGMPQFEQTPRVVELIERVEARARVSA